MDHIKVYENGNISVKFKFADQLRRIAEYIDVNTAESCMGGLISHYIPCVSVFS